MPLNPGLGSYCRTTPSERRLLQSKRGFPWGKLVKPAPFSTVSLPFFGGSMMRTVEKPIDEQSGLIE